MRLVGKHGRLGAWTLGLFRSFVWAIVSFLFLGLVPIPLPSYSPGSVRGIALAAAVLDLRAKDAIEPASQDPGFYNRLFVTPKVTGGWRPVIDLSRLNRFVRLSRFRMETSASVLQSLRPGDWMVSVDLQDAYLQVPVHPDSRRFLRFFQFKALCFGLYSAPQVFTWVMAPVSSIMHRYGFRILRYLDDWLVLGSSFQEITRARDFLLWLCDQLGILVNHSKSTLTPSQRLDYLGMTTIDSFEGFSHSSSCAQGVITRFRIKSPPDCSRALFGSLFWGSCHLSRRWFPAPGSACGRSNTACWLQVLNSGTTSWFPGTIPVSRIFGGGPSLPTWKSEFLSTFPIRISSCTPTPRTRVGVRHSALNISRACGLRVALFIRSTTESFWRSS